MFVVTKQFQYHKRLLYVQDSVHDYMKSDGHKNTKTDADTNKCRSGGRSTIIRTYATYEGEKT
jgi:hypothetical protein